MTRADIERRIRALDWPASSPALRTRVLGETSAAFAPVLWSDRVWFSRTFRWSVAAAMVAMMTIANWPGSARAERQPTGSVAAEAEAIRATAIDAGLPSDTAAELARRALAPRAPSISRAADLMQLIKTDGGF